MRFAPLFFLLFALSACTERSFTPTVPEALDVGTGVTVFAATTRAKNPDGSFGYDRSDRTRLLELTVSIPPSHTPGELEFGYADPDPMTQFTMAGRAEFASGAAFRQRLNSELAKLPPERREIVVFIHGYNATQAETAFRAAQVANDINVPGIMTIYSWPSQGKPLGYAYDNDSMLFARDGLEKMLYALKSTNARRIILAAHSMGSLLTMETLRQIELREPGWVARNIGAVMLMSPDLDIEVFRSQMARLQPAPQPFVIFVSQNDRILNISSRLRGNNDRERLGNIRNIDKVADLPVDIIDTTAFSKSAASKHLVAVTSPALIAMLNGARATHETFGPERKGIEDLLPGRVVREERATEIILLPGAESPT